MSSNNSSGMGSSCPNSVSFPNTRAQSTTFEMGSKVFRFQPMKSDVLLKLLLEEEEEYSVAEKKSPKHKTSHLMSHRGKYGNNDTFSSDDDDVDQNILDKTITEDDSVLNSRYIAPGVSWLDSPPHRKPLKIIAKPMISTPMSNMFNKLSIREQHSARKEPRSLSVDRKDEQKLPQTPAFKTPICRSAIPSPHNLLLSARKRQLELATPKQKLPIQPNKNLETPRHNSILQAAIHRNFNTPRSNLPSATKEDSKKSEDVLREKNLNVVDLQRQRSREIINEEKQTFGSEIKYVRNKQSGSNDTKKQSLFNNHSTINKDRPGLNKQTNSSELKQSNSNQEKQLSNKRSNSNEFKQSSINEERQLPNKLMNSNELRHLSNNQERYLQNKQLNSNEYKQSSSNEERQLPNKQMNSNEFKQSSNNQERYLENKQLNSKEYKQSSSSEERQLPNKQMNSNEFKQSSSNEEKQLPIKQINSIELQQLNNNEERQLPNKQNINEFKQSSIDDERQLPNKRLNSNEFKQSSSNEENHLVTKQSNGIDLKQSNNNEERQLANKEKNQVEVKQASVQINISSTTLQELTFEQLKVKGKEYIVVNKIGEGGSGQVYRCLELETFQDRAIKVVNLNVDPVTRNSYRNEVKMLKELQGNDRVIRMYDFEEIQQKLFVVMEKGDVDFSIFSRNLSTKPQIQTHIIVCYWIEMLKCVREIHKQGIIHSDLKPSNFLLVGGRLKLIDFGIASRLNADMTSVIKNVTVGTFNYISPEALLDSRESPGTDETPQLRISYKSDVWSLGCILYQMVYKRTPFQCIVGLYAKFATITDRNHKIEYQEIPGVPLYLIEMIKKCLVYDMRSRPTVQELLQMYYTGNYY